ncbi:DUF1351 domain-containing protein [Fangia hongkongensis]|uniref:DUF1351 domain-containing protein n=1 Tax=Fangia hongkongensis TaxID=270495 RepID=UPI00037EBB06|nr:DUF1351 domain-containing protein [Fangia hongkongensis]MBK2125894.1 DUF1351 domain-containing protein [Fangia hongkongensis]
MQELIVKHIFDLDDNMYEVKASIQEAIKKYDVVVTDDSVKDAKQMMASINKDKKVFSDKCKEFLEIVEQPIKDFKARRKDIESLYDDSRNRLKVQVDKYDAEKLERIKFIVSEYRNILCDEKSIDHNAITIDDLVMLTAVTSSNTVSSKTKQAIEQRIAIVEAEILRARLEAEEKAKRDREIAEQARIEAEERAKQREIEQAKQYEIEKQKAVEEARKSALKETITESTPAYQAYDEKPISEPVITDDGKRIFTITARFEVKAPSDTPKETIKSKITQLMNKAGVPDIKSIEVC